MGGHGGHSSGGGGSHDHAAAEPSVAMVWTNVLRSHEGLDRAVSEMSVPDAVYYGGLLRDDFKSLKTSARSMYLGMEEPLESANNRVKQLTKQIPKSIKANDQGAATTALEHLDVEIERVVALFPEESLPAEIVRRFDDSDSLDVDTDSEATEPTVQAEGAKYTCPMHQDVRLTQPGGCPKCGMALVKVTD